MPQAGAALYFQCTGFLLRWLLWLQALGRTSFSSCGEQAWLLCSMWDLPGSGVKPFFPVLAKSLQLCPTLCNPMDCSLSEFSVHGILQARILEGLPCPPRGDLLDLGVEPASLTSTCLAGGFLTTGPQRKSIAAAFLLGLIAYGERCWIHDLRRRMLSFGTRDQA